MTWLSLSAFGGGPALAQPGAAVGFRNELKTPVIVQGYSIVNGVQRRGQALLVPPGRVAWDSNVPSGKRCYSVYDANQTSHVYLRDFPVAVTGRDVFFVLRPSPANSNRAVAVSDTAP